ncbi:GAF domain-containing sensor histidine kinase [Streptomyces geranii]|uniref:GAF domain-containing sensor histidine kinase n=1 Tax=Streptomyces geranii TaxID=2058923 RepID=UPI000D02C401|nr:GAF domain-containing protein [Streptomyces geranii]
MGDMDPLATQHAELIELLDRRRAVRGALQLIVAGGDVAWMAEPISGPGDGRPHHLGLSQVVGDRTAMLPGLHVPLGHGLTGKVHFNGIPAWVDDYFGSTSITHTFDDHISAEGIRRLLAVPVHHNGQVFGVLALGARTDGTFGGRAVDQVREVADKAALAVAVAERSRLAREVAVYEERSRLAAELHDSVGALLFAIGSGMARLAETASGDPELTARLARIRHQADEASAALRDSLRTLRASPAALELSVGLRSDCTAFAERTGIPSELVVLDHEPPSLSASRTSVLVTGVREALLNVEKHAQASAVVVTAGPRHGGGIIVAVTDDGIGLPLDYKPGLGLTSTAESVGRVGGTVRVASEPEGGTTWRMELPC